MDKTEYHTEYYRDRLGRGLCSKCGRPREQESATQCNACIEKGKSRWHKRTERLRALGLCTKCGGERDREDRAYCASCRAKTNERVRLHRLKYPQRRQPTYSRYKYPSGLCRSCGKAQEVGCVCLACWFKRKATTATGTTADAGAVEKLLNRQKHRCPYSGRRLFPGINASIDHIVPLSEGGGRSLDNVQWLDTSVNVAKNSLSEKEFLALVADIYHTSCNP